MPQDVLYEQLKEIWETNKKSCADSLGVARSIYLDLVKLIISLSLGIIPLIGILVSLNKISSVKWFVIASLLAFAFTILFGIIALIAHALFYRAESNKYFKILQDASNHFTAGKDSFDAWIKKEHGDFLALRKGVKDLNYMWSILEVVFFASAIALMISAILLSLK